MIIIARDVLENIGLRVQELRQTLVTEGTRRLPGYAAYENALKERGKTGYSTNSTPIASPSPTVDRDI